MDTASERKTGNPLVVTGTGACLRTEAPLPFSQTDDVMDVTPFVSSRKMIKYMGKQDRMAVIAAGRALEDGSALEKADGERCGIFLAVGHIPFEREDIEIIARASTDDDGKFSMNSFSERAMASVNPLLTFRCLPNMPIFHVSVCFGIRGPYFITYPGIGQFYQALNRALAALQKNDIDLALVGGVADQNNFLVRHHYTRLGQPGKKPPVDSAGFLLIEREESARKREVTVQAVAEDFRVTNREGEGGVYGSAFYQEIRIDDIPVYSGDIDYSGPAEPVHFIREVQSRSLAGALIHRVRTHDHLEAEGRWRIH